MKIKLFLICLILICLTGCNQHSNENKPIHFIKDSIILKENETFNVREIVNNLKSDFERYTFEYDSRYLKETSSGVFEVLTYSDIAFKIIDKKSNIEIETIINIVPSLWSDIVYNYFNLKSSDVENLYDFEEIISSNIFRVNNNYVNKIREVIKKNNYIQSTINEKELYFNNASNKYILIDKQTSQNVISFSNNIDDLLLSNNDLIEAFNVIVKKMMQSNISFEINDFIDGSEITFNMNENIILNDFIKIDENSYKFKEQNALLILNNEKFTIKDFSVVNESWQELSTEILNNYQIILPNFVNIDIITLTIEETPLSVFHALVKTNISRIYEIENLFDQLSSLGWIIQEGSSTHLANFIHKDDDYYIIGIHESHGDDSFIELNLNINNKYA